jgi:hypothetical protein
MSRLRRRTVVVLAAALVAALTVSGAQAAGGHRNPPTVPNAGANSAPLRIISIVPSSYVHHGSLVTFGTALGRSLWLKAVESAYPPPGGVAAPQTSVLAVNDSPSLTSANSTDAKVQNYVYNKLKAKNYVALPGRQTIVVLYIPCSGSHRMDSFGCVSHHPRLLADQTSPATGQPESDVFSFGDSMAVVLGQQSGTLDQNTYAASHEFAEAYTDTLGRGQWRYHTADSTKPYVDSVPWVRDTGTIELADMGAGTVWYERDGKSGVQFEYQRILSNTAAAQGGDPDVPAGIEPYYDLSTARNWYHAHGATTVKVPVLAWATRIVHGWKVSASLSLTHGSGCSFSLPAKVKSDGVVAGQKFTLTVKAKGAIKSTPAWCTISLKSTKDFKDFGQDAFHLWDVGVVFDS